MISVGIIISKPRHKQRKGENMDVYQETNYLEQNKLRDTMRTETGVIV